VRNPIITAKTELKSGEKNYSQARIKSYPHPVNKIVDNCYTGFSQPVKNVDKLL